VVIEVYLQIFYLSKKNSGLIGENMPETGNKTTVAAVQATPVFLDKMATVKKACNLIEQAGQKGAKLVVFPEAFIPGYPDWVWVVPNSKSKLLNHLYVKLVENSMSIPDKSTDQLSQAAKSAKINVIIGLHERNTESSNSSLYNSLLYINDNGQIIGKHRKIVATGGERLIWAAGDGSTLFNFQAPFAKIGGLICWENYMPLARHAMYARGIEILAAPTWDKSDNWLLSLQHIAREGGMFVISCCSVIRMSDIPDELEFKHFYPPEKEWINPGKSCVVNPQGEFIAGPLENKEEILYAEIDLNQITAAKRMFDAAGHYARPDIFQFSVNHEAYLHMKPSNK
jgi:nitrilase